MSRDRSFFPFFIIEMGIQDYTICSKKIAFYKYSNNTYCKFAHPF